MSVWRYLGLAVTIIVTLLIGALLHNDSFSAMALFGVLVYFYYSEKSRSGLPCVYTNSILILVSFTLLLYSPDSILVRSTLFALLSMVSMYLNQRYFSMSSGPFFIIMIASLGGTLNILPDERLNQVLYLAAGVGISVISAISVQLIVRSKQTISPPKTEPKPLPLAKINALSLYYGVTLWGVYLINLIFPYHNYNWLTVSAAANLKEANQTAAIKRYGWYLLGNVFGIMIAWGTLYLTQSAPILLILSALFFFIIAFAIQINYGLALSFATPLAIFLLYVLKPIPVTELVTIRLISIIIGSLIGLISTVFINRLLHKMSDH